RAALELDAMHRGAVIELAHPGPFAHGVDAEIAARPCPALPRQGHRAIAAEQRQRRGEDDRIGQLVADRDQPDPGDDDEGHAL
nr:hypothetical protein [Tanacetum cinerariifolium]